MQQPPTKKSQSSLRQIQITDKVQIFKSDSDCLALFSIQFFFSEEDRL